MQSARAATLWQDGIVRTPKQELRGAHSFDVAIVGGGYTGLWTAYYLQQLAPALKIAIIEANYIGFGGSGRNGGWCSAFLPMSPSEMMEQHGLEAMLFAQQEMFATVDEVGEVAQRESIQCDFHKGGTITSASNPAHVQRLRDYVADWQKLGFGPDVLKWQTADDISERISVSRTFGGVYSPHCAVINPWKLVSGLADVVERRGVEIFENSSVINISERNVTTRAGHVTARWVVKAVESFGSQLNSMKRSIAPLYSLMVATEPLSADAWKSIGWNNRETFADGRNMVTYAQRTADAADGRPLHAEVGYLRMPSPGMVELVVSHPTGITEIDEGTFDGTTFRLRSTTVGRSASAKEVTAIERDIGVDGEVLSYDVRMAAVGLPLTHHLRAVLRLVVADEDDG